jgi:hypothetical protein
MVELRDFDSTITGSVQIANDISRAQKKTGSLRRNM